MFGGQVAGQALVAAGRTVPADRPVHSLHAYFIRPGDPAVPLVYIVDRVRDGKSFTTRRVSAIQHGKTIFTLSASFHHDEPGPVHAAAMPQVPPPESVPPVAERLEKLPGAPVRELFMDNPIDLRFVGPLTYEAQFDPVPAHRPQPGLAAGRWRAAGRPAAARLPDDLRVGHDAAGHGAAARTACPGRTGTPAGRASTMRCGSTAPFRADRWLLYAQDSPFASGARGLARGEVFTAEGHLVVSVVQEGLIRSAP